MNQFAIIFMMIAIIIDSVSKQLSLSDQLWSQAQQLNMKAHGCDVNCISISHATQIYKL